MVRLLLPLLLGIAIGVVAVFGVNSAGTRVAVDSLTAIPSPDSTAAPANLPESEGALAPPADTPPASEAEIATLASLSPPSAQRAAALSLLAALGNDDATIARIAAELPQANRLAFRLDALERRAASDPDSALRSALALRTSAARQLALPRIARAAAATDTASALGRAALIGDRGLRHLYLGSVASVWAESDAASALAWLESTVPAQLAAQAAAKPLQAIAASDSRLLLERIDELAPALQPIAREAAILNLATSDTNAAIAVLDALPAGRQRHELEAAVAEIFARADPAAAVAWALTRPDARTAVEGALFGAARVDYDLAVELALETLDTIPINSIYSLQESGGGDFADFVDRLFTADLENRESLMQQTLTYWPQADAKAALEWVSRNPESLNSIALYRLTLDGGREQPELAIAILDQVPAELRGPWLAGIAAGMAEADADRALAFVEQHRGEAGYADALGGIVDSMAESDPAAAAALVERSGARAAGRVAWAWAQRDPDAASAWVADLDNTEQRLDGVVNLASNWSRIDHEAAIDWLLELPPDQARDFGLQSAVQTATSRTGRLDPQLLEEIGDELIRGRTAVNALVVLARSDDEQARRLIDEHIDDPALRQQALRQIAEQSGGADITTLFSSRIDVPR